MVPTDLGDEGVLREEREELFSDREWEGKDEDHESRHLCCHEQECKAAPPRRSHRSTEQIVSETAGTARTRTTSRTYV